MISETTMIAYDAYKNDVVLFASKCLGISLTDDQINTLSKFKEKCYGYDFLIMEKDDLALLTSIVALNEVLFNQDKTVLFVSYKQNDCDVTKKTLIDIFDNLPKWLQCDGMRIDKNSITLSNNSTIVFSQENIINDINPNILVLNKFDSFEESKNKTEIVNSALSLPECRIIKINE